MSKRGLVTSLPFLERFSDLDVSSDFLTKLVADLPWMKVVNLNTLLPNQDLRFEEYCSKTYLAGFLSDLDERGGNINNTSSYFSPRRTLECRS